MRNATLRELLLSLRHNGISDPRVLDAIAQTPREAFISDPVLQAHAYADEALPIECEQTIYSALRGRLHERAASPTRENDVLEIGTGSGYQAAILSRLARHVYTIESHAELHRLAVRRFDELGLSNITAICGDGTKGWPDYRLFDRIIVTAGTREVPEELIDQLAPGGFMVIPLGPHGDQRITLITRNNGRLDFQALLPVQFVPLVRENPR